MGPTGAHRLVGVRPVEHGSGSYFSSMEKNPTVGGQGGLPHWAASPPWGREGVTLAISTPAKKTLGDFY
jgi:hypothetical protein